MRNLASFYWLRAACWSFSLDNRFSYSYNLRFLPLSDSHSLSISSRILFRNYNSWTLVLSASLCINCYLRVCISTIIFSKASSLSISSCYWIVTFFSKSSVELEYSSIYFVEFSLKRHNYLEADRLKCSSSALASSSLDLSKATFYS